MKRVSTLCMIVAVCLGLAISYRSLALRIERRRAIRQQVSATVPKAQKKPANEESVRLKRNPIESAEINWDVPFTPQAPGGNWDDLHKEACEEASALMVLRYFDGKSFADSADADRAIRELVTWNEIKLGYPVDQTAQQVAALLALKNKHLRISVVANPTEASLKQALREGNLAILPASGTDLGNPYFRIPGPKYHMLVLRGFTSDGHAITNDPGTKRGKAFLYTWERLLAANHDWNDGDVAKGDKVAVIVGTYVIEKR